MQQVGLQRAPPRTVASCHVIRSVAALGASERHDNAAKYYGNIQMARQQLRDGQPLGVAVISAGSAACRTVRMQVVHTMYLLGFGGPFGAGGRAVAALPGGAAAAAAETHSGPPLPQASGSGCEARSTQPRTASSRRPRRLLTRGIAAAALRRGVAQRAACCGRVLVFAACTLRKRQVGWAAGWPATSLRMCSKKPKGRARPPAGARQ